MCLKAQGYDVCLQEYEIAFYSARHVETPHHHIFHSLKSVVKSQKLGLNLLVVLDTGVLASTAV